MAEQLLRGRQEQMAVAGHAQGRRGDDAHGGQRMLVQARADRAQAVERDVDRFRAQATLRIQRGREAQRRVETVEGAEQAVLDGADEQAEAVRSKDECGVDGWCGAHADSEVENGATIAGLDDGSMTRASPPPPS